MGGKQKIRGGGGEVKKGGKVSEVELKLDYGSKKGCWTKLSKRASMEEDYGMQVVEAGSKRKSNGVEAHDRE